MNLENTTDFVENVDVDANNWETVSNIGFWDFKESPVFEGTFVEVAKPDFLGDDDKPLFVFQDSDGIKWYLNHLNAIEKALYKESRIEGTGKNAKTVRYMDEARDWRFTFNGQKQLKGGKKFNDFSVQTRLQ